MSGTITVRLSRRSLKLLKQRAKRRGQTCGTSTIFVAPSPWRYQRSLELMEKYRDVPMNLVDAVLVAISEELQTHDVLTLDARGFSAYRSRSKAFRLHPSSRA